MPQDHEHMGRDENVMNRGKRKGSTPPARRGGEGLLIGAGLTLLLFGTATLLLPTVSPQHAWIVHRLAERGVATLPMFAAGVLVCGLWLAVRVSRDHSSAAQEAARSSAPVLESLNEEVVHLRDALQGLRIEFVYLKDNVQTVVERTAASENNDLQTHGIYRLAASLDQLGQRIEEHLGTNQREVLDTLGDLSTSIRMARLESRGEPIHLPPGTDEDAEDYRGFDPLGQDTIVFRGDDSEDLGPTGHDHGTTAFPDERERLGVLDLLDDLGRLLPRGSTTTRAVDEITPDAFEGVQDEGWERHDSPTAPLPSARSGDLFGFETAGGLLSEGHQRDEAERAVVRKLEELRALLADDRVREALTDMERVKD